MALDLLRDKGTSLDKQVFTWKDIVQKPTSKLNNDAFTRVRVILMNGIEFESVMFSHNFARCNGSLRVPLAEIRQVEQHQQKLVNWLLPADLSPIETTLGYEQVAIEVTASVAQNEPDPYLAQAYRFGMLEDFDHMYRYSALLDRVEGKDANNILQSYTDILPGRPTAVEHRHASDNVRRHYEKDKAAFVSKLNALTLVAGEQQTMNYYLNIGPQFSDPVARLLYAEIASIEEQHVTHYESMLDPTETWLEKWLLHEATEVYNYYSCVQYESDPRIKAIWERFLDYELGHLALARHYFENIEKRDVAEILPAKLPEPINYVSQRDFVRQVLSSKSELDLRCNGTEFVPMDQESGRSIEYREQVNKDGSPSEAVAKGYKWIPGGELERQSAEWTIQKGATV